MKRWEVANQITEGATMTSGQIWELSKAWYHNRLSPDYRGRTLADVQAIFQQFELTSAFWQSSAAADAPQK